MNIDLRALALPILAVAASGASLAAQTVTVDYPDSVLEAPTLSFPLYTLGSGGTVRYQTQCPANAVGLPSQPMIVRAVGVQLAGQELYQRFEIRCGRAPSTGLTNSWDVNLPDQRIQKDLSGTVLPGGLDTQGNPVNRWVEFDLDYPFVYRPGDAVTLDVISSAATTGLWCSTATASHERLYDAPYQNSASGASLTPTNGLKLRLVFEPVGSVDFGAGCPGTGGLIPAIDSTGSAQTGASMSIDLANVAGGSTAFLLLGFSRSDLGGAPLPLPLGGGCDLLVSTNASFPVRATAGGPGAGTATLPITVPADAGLDGLVFYTQWAVFDTASPALGLAFSAALATPVYH